MTEFLDFVADRDIDYDDTDLDAYLDDQRWTGEYLAYQDAAYQSYLNGIDYYDEDDWYPEDESEPDYDRY